MEAEIPDTKSSSPQRTLQALIQDPVPTAAPANAPDGGAGTQPASSGVQAGKIMLKNVTSTGCELTWVLPAGEQRNYKIESHRLSLMENDEIKIEWLPMEGVELRQEKDGVTAHIKTLLPGALCAFRILSSNPAHKITAVSPTAQFDTTAKKNSPSYR